MVTSGWRCTFTGIVSMKIHRHFVLIYNGRRMETRDQSQSMKQWQMSARSFGADLSRNQIVGTRTCGAHGHYLRRQFCELNRRRKHVFSRRNARAAVNDATDDTGQLILAQRCSRSSHRELLAASIYTWNPELDYCRARLDGLLARSGL
jgi:hypothetical protein